MKDVLLPQAKDGRVLLVILRRPKEWGLEGEECDNVVQLTGGEARGAHINERTKIGKKILAHLGLASANT